jgi:hypothetical protein
MYISKSGDAMSTLYCLNCGKQVPTGTLFCPSCSVALPQLQYPTQNVMPAPNINTHTYAWIIMAFLVSFLWFKINSMPLFPLGFIGGLAITGFSWHIDRQVGKQSLAPIGIFLSFVGMVIGAITR